MKSHNREKFMQSDIALYGMFISVGLVLSYIESIIPITIPIPGVKLGLANVLVLWVLYAMDTKSAIIINILRVLLCGFLFGNMYSIIFGLCGAALSLLVMIVLRKVKIFTVVGVSIAGAVAHNTAQILVAMAVLQNARLVYYYPALLISAVVTGVVVGILCAILYKKIRILNQNELKSKIGEKKK